MAHSRVSIWQEVIVMIQKKDIENAPDDTVYIFGDNLDREGLGGQAAVARPFVEQGKAFGIPTKRHPGMDEGDFFSDRNDEILFVKRAFAQILQMKQEGKKIIFFPSIGEGRAELPERSPMIHDLIKNFVEKHNEV